MMRIEDGGVMTFREAAPSGANGADRKIAISTGLLALALGSGLGATPAEAKLITTPLNVDVAPGETYNFGPVGDEFTVSNFGTMPLCPDIDCPSFLEIGLQGNTTALSKNFVAVKASGGSPPLLDFFKPGDTIDDSLLFAPQGIDLIFKPANNIVYGLKSVDLSDPFGFVQLDVLPGNDLHLDLFAFQDTPGKPAVVVPEPGTLSLFAVGGVALLAARRRKKQQKTA
jgi:hypothetical protein